MKATLEIPDDLLRDLKIRAAEQHRKLKDVTAELLRIGLRASAGQAQTVLPATGLELPAIPATALSRPKRRPRVSQAEWVRELKRALEEEPVR